MYSSAIDYLNSSYTADTDTTASSDLGQDAFLTLLLAQLENQDPLNPTDNTEMLTELAQFSELEQLATLNETMEYMATAVSTASANSALGYIGTDVTAESDTVMLDEDGASTVVYTLGDDAEDVTVNIFDSDGQIVQSVDLGAHLSGEYTFQWDGLDYNGDEASDGFYTVSFATTDEYGDAVSVSTEVSGTVIGLSSTDDGDLYLELDDGRLVSMWSVSSVKTTSDSDA